MAPPSPKLLEEEARRGTMRAESSEAFIPDLCLNLLALLSTLLISRGCSLSVYFAKSKMLESLSFKENFKSFYLLSRSF